MANLRLPPHADEAEKSILGSVLIDKDAIVDIAVVLKPEMFYNDNNGKIFEAMVTLYESRDPIDVLTVSDWLKKNKLLDRVGGRAHLSELSNEVPVASHVQKYAQIVRDCYIKRLLISAGAQMGEMGFDEGKPLGEILDKAEQSIYALSQTHVRKSFIPIKDALAESFDRLDSLHNSPDGLRGVPTGFSDLDNMLAGMQDSNLIILAARPGIGKTTLATNIAQFAAVERKMPVGYFALEMSNLEMVDRMLVGQANIDAWKLNLSEAMGVLADCPLYIDDTPGQSILELRTKARKLHSQVGLKLLVVDYLQLVVGDKSYESRVQEVGAISQGLKNLARELKIPVLALSQLNRGIESRTEKIPQLADLRESGSIEQDADVVMFMYRTDDNNLEDMKLSIAKHRNGGLGSIDLKFRGDRVKFYGIDRGHQK
ncbi:MAG: Replicative DNA helicase [Microgenomates group bacterium GW2011_GWC1_44_10]|nr:MAG: Replicative DNA helicase [Microgenomates group bacterium GW2011_GWC1_44_10]